jgi:hypothetical protein
MAGIKNDHLVI